MDRKKSSRGDFADTRFGWRGSKKPVAIEVEHYSPNYDYNRIYQIILYTKNFLKHYSPGILINMMAHSSWHRNWRECKQGKIDRFCIGMGNSSPVLPSQYFIICRCKVLVKLKSTGKNGAETSNDTTDESYDLNFTFLKAFEAHSKKCRSKYGVASRAMKYC